MAAVPPPLPQRDWAQRNRLWFLPLLVVLGLGLIVGLVLGVFSTVRNQMTSHPAYVEALARARKDPKVIAELGQPMEPGLLVMGSVQQDSDGGHAFLSIPLIGPKAEAKLSVIAFNYGEGEEWEYTTMALQLADGREISLLTTPPSLPEDSDDSEESRAPGCDRPEDDGLEA